MSYMVYSPVLPGKVLHHNVVQIEIRMKLTVSFSFFIVCTITCNVAVSHRKGHMQCIYITTAYPLDLFQISCYTCLLPVRHT